MSSLNHFDKLRLAGAAAIAGLALGATAAIVRADPGLEPVQPPSAAASTPQPHSDTMGAAISDTAITTRVKMGFLNDSRLHGSDLNVTTANGLVTLSGRTPNRDSAAVATEIAESVKGVKAVDASRIMVASTVRP